MAPRNFLPLVGMSAPISICLSSYLYKSDFGLSKAFTLVVFVAVLGLLYLAMAVYKFIVSPVELGGHEGRDSYLVKKAPLGMTPEETMSHIKGSRKVGDVPPVYPNGWFALMRSGEIKEGETKYVHALGESLMPQKMAVLRVWWSMVGFIFACFLIADNGNFFCYVLSLSFESASLHVLNPNVALSDCPLGPKHCSYFFYRA